jgi:predicted HD phosphohydrolase
VNFGITHESAAFAPQGHGKRRENVTFTSMGTTESHQRAEFTTFDQSSRDDWELIASQLPFTQAMAAANIMTQLELLDRDHGGFPVSRLEHSLQTATRAEADGRDDEYVLCALVHDIGDTLAPFNHPSVAAGIVKPFVSEAHHWMVEHHGIFQGYYFWHHIGLDRDAREEFRDSEFFDYTEEFCAKYDSTAFDAEFRSNPLSYYEPLIRAQLRGA